MQGVYQKGFKMFKSLMLKSILLFCPAKELGLVREVNGLSYNKKIES
jgi:hypothetical protein